MAVVVFADWMDEPIDAVRDQGAITNITRHFLVTGLDSGTPINRVAQALNATGVPQYGDAYPGNAGVIAKSHRLRMLQDKDSTACAVISVDYVTVGQEDGFYVFHGDGSVSEEETDSDVEGHPIRVSYTDSGGTTYVQGKTVPFMDPQSTLSTTGIEPTSVPLTVQNQWNGYVNSDTWNGYPAGCWMCTRCSFTPHDLNESPPLYKFTFEFQLKRRGWTPTAYYIDPATGEPPSDLVTNFGRKRVVVQGYRPFSDKFASIA